MYMSTMGYWVFIWMCRFLCHWYVFIVGIVVSFFFCTTITINTMFVWYCCFYFFLLLFVVCVCVLTFHLYGWIFPMSINSYVHTITKSIPKEKKKYYKIILTTFTIQFRFFNCKWYMMTFCLPKCVSVRANLQTQIFMLPLVTKLFFYFKMFISDLS